MKPELTNGDRKVLRELINKSKKYPDGIVPGDRQKPSDQKFYLHHLWQEKLIWDATLPDTPENQNGMPVFNGFVVSPEGQHYFEKYHEYKHEQFLNGIVWPIIVALITSLVANTPNWLPVLLKWI